MRNSTKVKSRENPHGPLFLAARLFARHPHCTLRGRRGRRLHRSRSARPSASWTTARTISQIYPLGMVPAIRTGRRRPADRERRDPAICRRALSRRRTSRRAQRHRARAAAAMAVLHRHRTAQGPVHAAVRQEGAAKARPPMRWRRANRGSPSQRPSRRAANSCSTTSRRRRVSVHGAELEHGDAGDVRPLPGDPGLLHAHAASGRASRRRSARSSRSTRRKCRGTRRREQPSPEGRGASRARVRRARPGTRCLWPSFETLARRKRRARASG